jgi:tetratricopeptide (TPR) repeat protein
MENGSVNVRSSNDQEALLQLASQALAGGEMGKAVIACKSLNREFPEFAPGWAMGSRVALRLGNADKSLEFIERALAIEPKSAHLYIFRAQGLLAKKQLDQAITSAQKAAGLGPDAKVLSTAATFLGMHCSEHALACPYYERAVALTPENAEYQFSLAAVYRFLGKVKEAESTWNRAIDLNPDYHEAYLLRSEVSKQTVQSNHIAELENLVSVGIKDWRGESMLCHALAKEYEDTADYNSSFAWLKRGSYLRQKHTRYDVAADEKTMDEIAQQFSKTLMQQVVPGSDSDEPIFILGLPRTGSTLLERILSSHDDVFAAGELNAFALELVRICQQGQGTDKIARDDLVRISTAIDFSKLGQSYVESTRPRTGQVPRFIDKMPNNFLYCGLIHRALPQAKIIHIMRNPMDSCYAMYKRLFKSAYPMSYNLEQLGRYYLAYRQLMHHWSTVMPGTMLEIRYEDLVANQEYQTKRVLEYCDLDWQENCLHFEKNEAPSTTASATQVREPIYKSAQHVWRNYEKQLRPLRDLLEAGGIDVHSPDY